MKLSDELKKIGRATPREWGTEIVDRYGDMLAALERGESYEGDVGCPHCIMHDEDCRVCEFTIGMRFWQEYPCCRIEFGGEALFDGNCRDVISLRPCSEAIADVSHWHSDFIGTIRAFLEAHVQFGHYITRWGKESTT